MSDERNIEKERELITDYVKKQLEKGDLSVLDLEKHFKDKQIDRLTRTGEIRLDYDDPINEDE